MTGVQTCALPISRVVLEKPIGHDLESARSIIHQVGEIFSEAQTFRIDHFLGKETVQNLMALRFANTIFERLWSTDVIDQTVPDITARGLIEIFKRSKKK